MTTMNLRLKELRQKENMTQREFGNKLFLSQDQISLMEKGNRNITKRVFANICDEFDVNPEWLEFGTGDTYLNKGNKERSKEIENLLDKLTKLDTSALKTVSDLITLLTNQSKKEDEF